MKTALLTGKVHLPQFTYISQQIQDTLKKLNIDSFIVSLQEITTRNFDIIFCIGGDGNFIASARKFIYSNKPIIGINTGTLGFLPTINPKEIEQKIPKIINSPLWMNRMLLTGSSTNGQKLIALNDFLFSNDRKGVLSEFTICLNDDKVMKVRADGILISTPTGSTAYNLSAGGPIILPDMDVIVITPICSHILGERPIIISLNNKIRIKNHSNQAAKVWADGQEDICLAPTEYFTLSAPLYIKTPYLTKQDFFQTLSNKLGWNSGYFKDETQE